MEDQECHSSQHNECLQSINKHGSALYIMLFIVHMLLHIFGDITAILRSAILTVNELQPATKQFLSHCDRQSELVWCGIL